MPQQGQDDAENMITADAGGVVSFRKTGVMQTIQYEMHVPPNALNQDQQISLRLKDTYGQGFVLEITSDATFTIEPHLHFNYLLDISLAEVLGYDLGSLLDDFGESQRVSDFVSWAEDMQKPHDLPVSSTPIRKPDLYRLGLYHYDSRQDHWVPENSYVEVRLIRTEQNRRYLSIYAYTRMDGFSQYALGDTAPMITKDPGRASMPTRLVQDPPEFDITKIHTTFIPQTDSLQ